MKALQPVISQSFIRKVRKMDEQSGKGNMNQLQTRILQVWVWDSSDSSEFIFLLRSPALGSPA